jgi:prefoldin subunit 5
LNALSALKSKDNTDLSVDETYLLFPFIYKKLGQEMTATTSYNEAIQYYQTRIANLDKPYNRALSGLNTIKQTRDDYELVINNNLFELNRELPESFIKNPDRIALLLNTGNTLAGANAKKQIKKLNELQQDYKTAYKTVENSIMSQRKDYLNSYLNQSRYGLANLYDNSLPDNK